MSSLTEANLRALTFTRSFELEILVSVIRPAMAAAVGVLTKGIISG
ncbi:hypothetical protein [Streptomyces shaanxiensis]